MNQIDTLTVELQKAKEQIRLLTKDLDYLTIEKEQNEKHFLELIEIHKQNNLEVANKKDLLKAGKDQLELLLESLNEVVWGRTLPDYRMQYISKKSAVSLYGFSIEEWYENPDLWHQAIHPDDKKRVDDENTSLFTAGFSELDYRIITKDKKTKWVRSKTRILKSTEGTPFFMTGIAQDITDQKNNFKQIETQKSLLSNSKNMLELVMGSLDEVVWGRNLPDYEMQYVSDSVVNLYGFPMADWYENPNLWSDMIHPDDIKQVEKEGESLFKLGITELEYRVITADKKIKWIRSTTRIIKRTDGTPFFMTGIAQDISIVNEYKENLEQKVKHRTIELEESLEREKELSKLKSSFVSTASHQFRTPLASIQANSELLEIVSSNASFEYHEKCKKVTSRIKLEIHKMIELMDEILVLGKLTSGNVNFKPQELDLFNFCGQLVQELNELQTDGRVINIVTEGNPYNVYVDHKLLTHSLTNLLSNAFKYSLGKSNPKLTISFKLKGFSLTIEDDGIGIPKAEMSNLFHPFFRGSNTTEIKGTGLGLSIAKEYIEINKGILTVKSAEGVGSRFKISFKR